MNVNSGKTGTVNIPGALHSTGGDGDGLVGNVVVYAGDIFDDRVSKNQRDINKEFSDKLTSIEESTGGVDEFTVEQMIKAQSASINNMMHTVNANSDRIQFTLTGSGTTYSGTTGDEMKDRIIVAALSSYPSIYQTSSSEQELAAVRSASYNTNSQKFVLTLTDSLGNVTNADYYFTAIAKPNSVCLGGYMQSGYNDNVIGSENFVKGNHTNVYGGYNTVSGDTVSVIGKVNIALENSQILGNNNKILKNSCGIMGEFNEIPSSAQTESYLIGSNNKIKGDFRGYALGRYNAFQPQLASGETGVALGEYLTLFNGGIALGKYNFNDYVQSADKQSFFTVSNGQSKYSGKNLIDVKKDGSFYLYGCGGYEGQSTANPAIQTVQEILNQLYSDIQSVSANTGGGSGSSSGGSITVTSDADWVNEVLPGAILVSGVTITAKWIADKNRGNYVYLGFEADREVNWDLFDIDVYNYNTERHYNRNIHDYTRIVDGCLMSELNQLSTLKGNIENISTEEIVIKGKPSFGYSYTIEYDENIANQFEDGCWEIYNNGNNISY